MTRREFLLLLILLFLALVASLRERRAEAPPWRGDVITQGRRER